MTYPTVTNVVTDALGNPVPYATVVISLMGGPTFTTDATAAEIISSATLSADAIGAWSTPMEPNVLIQGVTYYLISEPGSSWQVTIPNTPGTFKLRDLNPQRPTTFTPPPIPAGGDLTGAYPDPTLVAVGTAGTVGDAAHSLTVTTDAKGRVTAAIAAPIVIGEAAVTGLVADLAAKAPLASPALTGTPTAPTQTALNNSTRLATTAYADSAVGVETAARGAAVTSEATARTNADALLIPLADKGAASGVAPLDAGSRVPEVNLPADLAAATLSATYVSRPAAEPAWSTRVNTFDGERGLYNFNARTLARFREAKARAVSGGGQLHISVLGDSTTMQADYTTPASVTAWPARMRDYLMRNLGLTNAGTGIMPLWELFGPTDFTPQPEWPQISYYDEATGALTQFDQGYSGIYGYNAVSINTGGAPYTRVEMNPTAGQLVDEFWVYMASVSDNTFATVTDGTTTHQFEIGSYFGKTFTPTAGWTAVTPEAGYVTGVTPSTDGGIVVAKLVIPVAQANWTLSVRARTAGGVSVVNALEGRLSTAGLRVSNLAQGGMALLSILAANQEVVGKGGLPQAFDTPGADLALIALGINDWQGHHSVSDFHANLTTAVLRQKHVGTTGTTNTGTGAAGDVLLVIQPEPDYTEYPLDHIEVPALSEFWRVMYEVADEQDVALVDQSYRWIDYASTVAMRRARGDDIHPNDIGHADLGLAIAGPLATV